MLNIKTKKDNTRLFRYNFRNDDFLLALNPFLMIPFLNENNQYYVIPVILFNLLYWTRKNLITFLFDSIFAIFFINMVFKKCYINEIYLLPFILTIMGLFFLYKSNQNILQNKRQIFHHIIFRLCFFIIFLISEF
jgi:membrane-associated HD superfamily phosphohydrolase